MIFFVIPIIFVYSIFLIFLFLGLRNVKSNRLEEYPVVSVLIAVRNEKDYISACVKALLGQNYPSDKFEVIVIDDFSTDGTRDILKDFSAANLVVLHNPTQYFSSRKKSALQAGLEKAAGEILLFTDADCTPPENWIRQMVCQFSNNIGLVAGFSPQKVVKKGLWDNLLYIDSLSAAFVACGTIGWGLGITCAGRNLACKRQALNEIGGYSAFPNSVSGDDDFLLQAVAKHPCWNVTYNCDPQTIVPAAGPKNLRAFLIQKQRHISAGQYYSKQQQLGYSFFHVVNFALWLGLPFAVLNPLFALPLFIKIFLDFVFLNVLAGRFRYHINLFSFLVWEGLFVLYNLVAGFRSLFCTIRWKE